MSLFTDSTAVVDAPNKIFFWGPQGAGKTHTAMTWPEPIFVDREGGRALHFRDRFQFKHFAPTTLEQLAEAFKELRSGAVPGKTVVTDSGSAIYQDLVQQHTTRTDSGAYVTDWVTVNRRFLACLNFAFGIVDKNVIFTGHAATKLVRTGRDFKAEGLKFIGDDRFRYAFDYIFRIEPKGDPRVTPALFHVEKSASPALKIGDVIQGLDYAKFVKITRPDPALSTAQLSLIRELAKRLDIDGSRYVDFIKAATGGRTTVDGELTSHEAERAEKSLRRKAEERAKAGAA